TASGATFPAVIYTKWVDEYYKATGVQVNYQAIGSGGGIKAITEKTVDFAGSDAPMTDAQLAAASSSILHIPTVMGAVVPPFNVPGVTKLNLTPETLPGIYLGTTKTWHDPTLDAVSKAAVGVTYPDDLRVSITNSPNAEAWPISTFTFLLTYKDISDHAKALAMARYFWWGTHDGQNFTRDLGYAPLPGDVLT